MPGRRLPQSVSQARRSVAAERALDARAAGTRRSSRRRIRRGRRTRPARSRDPKSFMMPTSTWSLSCQSLLATWKCRCDRSPHAVVPSKRDVRALGHEAHRRRSPRRPGRSDRRGRRQSADVLSAAAAAAPFAPASSRPRARPRRATPLITVTPGGGVTVDTPFAAMLARTGRAAIRARCASAALPAKR